MQKNTRKNMSYSFDIKLKAVKMYLDEGIGSTTIAKELNLSRSMVNKELSAIRKLLKSKLESEGYYYETK